MRTLLIPVGNKLERSTFIQKNQLEHYVLSLDVLRNMLVSPSILNQISASASLTLSANGNVSNTLHSFNNQQEDKVSHYYWEFLSHRMHSGEFTILDSDNLSKINFGILHDLVIENRYKVFYINLSQNLSIVIDNCVQINQEYGQNINFNLSKNSLPVWCKEIRSFIEINNFWEDNLDKYEEIYIIGDVHASYDALRKLINPNEFQINGQLNRKNKYIFLGDYLDRGVQNKETFDLLNMIKDEPNVVFIEGNHEVHMKNFASNLTINNRGFITQTLPELLNIDKEKLMEQLIIKFGLNNYSNHTNSSFIVSGLDKVDKDELLSVVLSQADNKDIRQLRSDFKRFYQRCCQAYLFEFHGKKFFCNHGGLPFMPELIFVPTKNLIYGIGSHIDGNKIAQLYRENYLKGNCQGFIQVFGHRVAKSNEYCINLIDGEQRDINIVTHNGSVNTTISGVEFGGNLPVLKITPNDMEILYFKNDIFDLNNVRPSKNKRINTSHQKKSVDIVTANTELNELLKNKENVSTTIQYDPHGNSIHNLMLVQFNYIDGDSSPINSESKWTNNFTSSFYADIKTGETKICTYPDVKSYNKCRSQIYDNAVYPMSVYERKDGFLGFMANVNDELVLATKSSISGGHKILMEELWNNENKDIHYLFQELAKQYNCTFVFEVIHPNAQHILKHTEENSHQLILIDVLPNNKDVLKEINLNHYSKMIMDEIFQLITDLNIPVKFLRRVVEISDCFSFKDIKRIKKEINKNNNDVNSNVESYIFRDAQNMMFKCYSVFYHNWKSCQTLVKGFATSLSTTNNGSSYNISQPQLDSTLPIRNKFSLSKCKTTLEINFMSWLLDHNDEELKSLGIFNSNTDGTRTTNNEVRYKNNNRYKWKWNIIDLREKFLAETS